MGRVSSGSMAYLKQHAIALGHFSADHVLHGPQRTTPCPRPFIKHIAAIHFRLQKLLQPSTPKQRCHQPTSLTPTSAQRIGTAALLMKTWRPQLPCFGWLSLQELQYLDCRDSYWGLSAQGCRLRTRLRALGSGALVPGV